MSEAVAPDQSGERAVPPSQGSAGSSSHCSKRASRAAMSDEEYWEDVFNGIMTGSWWGQPPTDLEHDEDPPEAYELSKPCTECGEFVCGYDWNGRPMYHRQREEDD